MCNAKPGLRCDTHAIQKVNAQQIKIADIRSEMATATPQEKAQLVVSLQRAEERLKEDNLEYSLTAAGQQEMAEIIRQRQLLGEDTEVLYDRLGAARRLATRRREASQVIEASPTMLEQQRWDTQMSEFENSLEPQPSRKRGASLRKERQKWKSINNAARDTYTSLLNNGDRVQNYERILVEKIRMSKYFLTRIDDMDAANMQSMRTQDDTSLLLRPLNDLVSH